MKYLLFLIPFISFAQVDVPDEYWIDDNNFEDIINSHNAFGDDDKKPIVVEFWAKFNEANCFAERDKLESRFRFRTTYRLRRNTRRNK